MYKLLVVLLAMTLLLSACDERDYERLPSQSDPNTKKVGEYDITLDTCYRVTICEDNGGGEILQCEMKAACRETLCGGRHNL
jgi:hypothetical protein